MSMGSGMPTRTGATIGAKLAMIFCFSTWSGGISSSAESTSETESSRSKAAAFPRSSSSERALASPLNPERPVARTRFSQITDSVPSAWRFRRL